LFVCGILAAASIANYKATSTVAEHERMQQRRLGTNGRAIRCRPSLAMTMQSGEGARARGDVLEVEEQSVVVASWKERSRGV
jgi:hypothetical protein